MTPAAVVGLIEENRQLRARVAYLEDLCRTAQRMLEAMLKQRTEAVEALRGALKPSPDLLRRWSDVTT